jgi:hypothetical protein
MGRIYSGWKCQRLTRHLRALHGGLGCIALIGLLCFKADYVLVGVFLAFVLVVMWTVLFARFRDIR